MRGTNCPVLSIVLNTFRAASGIDCLPIVPATPAAINGVSDLQQTFVHVNTLGKMMVLVSRMGLPKSLRYPSGGHRGDQGFRNPWTSKKPSSSSRNDGLVLEIDRYGARRKPRVRSVDLAWRGLIQPNPASW
ncbi:MAG: hypothetical protein AAFY08_01400 [Planctomycetota bacterium]